MTSSAPAGVAFPRGVGLGFRTEIAHDLAAEPSRVDFVEVVAETCFTQRSARREANAVRALWPVVPHGVKLSLGSAEGIDRDRVRRLGLLARELRAPVLSEHVAFTRGGGVEIGHLTQLPRTRQAVRVVARNVDRARRDLPDVPLLLENVAWTFRWPDDEMSEADFYAEVVRATGCPLLLDLGNLYANAVNQGLDPCAVLRGYPLAHVAMVHIAGGITEGGFYFDTHAHAIPDAAMDLLGTLFEHRPGVPVLLERDANFDWPAICTELAALRESTARAPGSVPQEVLAPPRASAPAPSDDADLAASQATLARVLTRRAPPDDPLSVRIGRDAIERSRVVLDRKRIDDALPLLPSLARQEPRIRDVAARALSDFPRPAHGAGVADAWRICAAALQDPALVPFAQRDRLVLRARFLAPARDGTLRPRRMPFLGTERLPGGRRLVAAKGPGSLASVTLHERPR